MVKCNLKEPIQPVDVAADPLTEMLRQGAKDLIAQAVESELLTLLDQHQGLRLLDGRQALVRNGYLPERSIQTGLGDVEVKVPKVRDRSGSGICFHSALLPPYLKRARNCGSRETTLAMVYKLLETAQKRWKRINPNYALAPINSELCYCLRYL